ncbi:uncharacterized protein GIQ15_00728 [Arthroderma uncinatum]|uniref:uncharacterized protein n=1 Tax=Arthroderma uncinatum TaxID=74035 RepID=UPI00144AD873|nr:uncharacterized protein GIQ15_00728 [Arthroderma uncinatum]KAF3491211.1 hypothetical protein GIQ15_00728 [Arthroderma uncinatum]
MITVRCGGYRLARPERQPLPCWKYEPQRIYGQDVSPSLIEFPVGDLVFTTHANSLSRRYTQLEPDLGSIVIAVDGACSGNGTPYQKAAAGVYVGENSQHNISLQLTPEYATNQRAELIAGLHGLDEAKNINDNGIDGQPLAQVIIKTDSAYMVNGVTQWVDGWEANGYTNANGRRVTNYYLFEELARCIRRLAASGVNVYFWHVLREHNTEADQLARNALTS